MRALIIGEQERGLIDAAMKQARARVIPWSVLAPTVPINQETDTLKLTDRPQGSDRALWPAVNVELPVGYRLAVSFEEQPAGVCAHISLSFETGVVPRPETFVMAAEACGLTEQPARAWVEEYMIGGQSAGHAVNAVWIVEPAR